MEIGEHWVYQRDAYQAIQEVKILAIDKKVRVRFLESDEQESDWVKKKRLPVRWGERAEIEALAEKIDRLLDEPPPEFDSQWNAAEIILVALDLRTLVELHPFGVAKLTNVGLISNKSGVSAKKILESPSIVPDGESVRVPWRTVEAICKGLAKREPEAVLAYTRSDRAYWADRIQSEVDGEDREAAARLRSIVEMFEPDHLQVEAWCGHRTVAVAKKLAALTERYATVQALAMRAAVELDGKSTARARALAVEIRSAVDT